MKIIKMVEGEDFKQKKYLLLIIFLKIIGSG